MAADSETASKKDLGAETTANNSDFETGDSKPIRDEKLTGAAGTETDPVADEKAAATADAAASDEYPHGFRLVVLVAAVMITVFLTSLDQTIVGTAIPKITDEFHGLSQVSWYGSAYFMCLGGFQPAWGKAFKMFPLKTTFIVSICIFELGSLICGVAPTSEAFIVGRAIAGVGGAGTAIGGTVISAFCAPPEKRPTLMGFIGFAYTIAAIFGPLLGGAFADRVTWRWCFYINLPIGGVALALIIVFFQTPEIAKVDHGIHGWKQKFLHMDPLGIALAMGGIISFILALQYGGVEHAWGSSIVVGLLVGSIVILAVLFAWELTLAGDYAMLPWQVLGRRAILAPSIFQAFFAGCYFLLLYYLPIYFQSIKGVDAVQSGVDNLALVIAGCLAIVGGGIAVTTSRHATPFMIIGAAVTAVGCGLLYTLDVDTGAGKWIGFQILLGVSVAFPFQNALNIMQAHTDPDDMSVATSILYFFQILGGAFSVSAAQSAFVNRLIATLAETAPNVPPLLVVATGASQLRGVFTGDDLTGVVLAYMSGIRAAFAVAIGMAGVAFLLAFLLPFKRLPKGSPGDAVMMA
ncbi:putative efflux pump antibiotic resistance protein [Lasiosphaeria ovina]|uniref:Efflux pump antibiotic resistance protein n=1 Tax=Lasiosphaeria ovina TaxID=92902 RepID=A0AAE0KHY0_9PEZI|nr:putative efflux pump antibiotic resistance protein [Lasiosphaeria ovina]